jgi:hypothetical protein
MCLAGKKLGEERKTAHAAWHVKPEQTVVTAQYKGPCPPFM